MKRGVDFPHVTLDSDKIFKEMPDLGGQYCPPSPFREVDPEVKQNMARPNCPHA